MFICRGEEAVVPEYIAGGNYSLCAAGREKEITSITASVGIVFVVRVHPVDQFSLSN